MEYKIFASKYESVEEMEKNREKDRALDLTTRTRYKKYNASSIIEGAKMFVEDKGFDELDNYSSYYLYYIGKDGSINNIIL